MAESPKDENLQAKLNLFAVLPLLEILAESDAKAKKWAGRIKSPVVIKVAGVPEMSVCITGGDMGLRVGQNLNNAGVVIEFPAAQSLNTLFAGGSVLPKVRGMLRQPGSIISIGFLLKRLSEVITNKDTTPELRANLIINAIARFFEVLGNLDPSFASVLNKQNAVIAWTIKPSGPAAYISIENGVWKFYRGSASGFTVAIEFSSLEGFFDLIEGRDTARMAFFMGNIRPRGDAMLAMKVGFLMQEVQKYLKRE